MKKVASLLKKYDFKDVISLNSFVTWHDLIMNHLASVGLLQAEDFVDRPLSLSNTYAWNANL